MGIFTVLRLSGKSCLLYTYCGYDYFDDDDSDADYSDNDSIVEYEEAAEESDITKSTSEIQSNSDDLEEYLDD